MPRTAPITAQAEVVSRNEVGVGAEVASNETTMELSSYGSAPAMRRQLIRWQVGSLAHGRWGQQFGQADQVVGGQRQGELPAGPAQAAMPGLAPACDGLDPGEHFFDALAFCAGSRVEMRVSAACFAAVAAATAP